ncbi:hypothetical protein A2U01_0112338, partial [Trifolium medium]|nr:hypothetical protein [Trifolium medium]
HGTSNLVRIHDDVTLFDLKHHLNSLLHFRDQRRVTEIAYRRSSVCADEMCCSQKWSFEPTTM